MYKSESGITFKLGLNDDSDGVKIVYFIKTLVLIIHLFVDAVNGFDSSLKCEIYMILR